MATPKAVHTVVKVKGKVYEQNVRTAPQESAAHQLSSE